MVLLSAAVDPKDLQRLSNTDENSIKFINLQKSSHLLSKPKIKVQERSTKLSLPDHMEACWSVSTEMIILSVGRFIKPLNVLLIK